MNFAQKQILEKKIKILKRGIYQKEEILTTVK